MVMVRLTWFFRSVCVWLAFVMNTRQCSTLIELVGGLGFVCI